MHCTEIHKNLLKHFSGIVLSGYAIGLGLGAIVLPESIPHYIDCLHEMGPAAVSFVKFSLSFPMAYHFWNGIRHLIWDTGKMLTIPQVYTTGYIMLAVTFATAGFLTVM